MKAPSVREQPHFSLFDWIIVKSHDRYHLVGYDQDLTAIRATTPIVSIDTEKLTCRTQSGRHYSLVGRASQDIAPDSLTYFQQPNDLNAEDATDFVLINPFAIYDVFKLKDKTTGELVSALPTLQNMATDPLSWLPQLTEILVECDFEMGSLHQALGLTEIQWTQWRECGLKTVPLETALRGWLLRGLLDSMYDLEKSWSSLIRWMDLRMPGLCAGRTTHEILQEADLGAVIALRKFWDTIRAAFCSLET